MASTTYSSHNDATPTKKHSKIFKNLSTIFKRKKRTGHINVRQREESLLATTSDNMCSNTTESPLLRDISRSTSEVNHDAVGRGSDLCFVGDNPTIIRCSLTDQQDETSLSSITSIGLKPKSSSFRQSFSSLSKTSCDVAITGNAADMPITEPNDHREVEENEVSEIMELTRPSTHISSTDDHEMIANELNQGLFDNGYHAATDGPTTNVDGMATTNGCRKQINWRTFDDHAGK